MTVKEFCEKYRVSHQAVYAKKRKISLAVTSSKKSLKLDSFAEEMLKPVIAGEKFFEENTNLKIRFAEVTEGYNYFRDECSAKSEKISNP